mgnify:CR=1 FL=1
MKIIKKIKSYIFKKKTEKIKSTEKIKPIDEDPEYMFHLIEQGLRNGWYKDVTAIDTIERDIEFLKSCGNSFLIKNYISRLEARIEEIKRGGSNE